MVGTSEYLNWFYVPPFLLRVVYDYFLDLAIILARFENNFYKFIFHVPDICTKVPHTVDPTQY